MPHRSGSNSESVCMPALNRLSLKEDMFLAQTQMKHSWEATNRPGFRLPCEVLEGKFLEFEPRIRTPALEVQKLDWRTPAQSPAYASHSYQQYEQWSRLAIYTRADENFCFLKNCRPVRWCPRKSRYPVEENRIRTMDTQHHNPVTRFLEAHCKIWQPLEDLTTVTEYMLWPWFAKLRPRSIPNDSKESDRWRDDVKIALEIFLIPLGAPRTVRQTAASSSYHYRNHNDRGDNDWNEAA